MSISNFQTYEFLEKFGRESDAIAFFEIQRWPDGVICPICNSKNTTPRPSRKGYRCKSCRTDFSVKTKTIFEGSNIALNKWLFAIHFMTFNDKITGMQLANEISVTQKSAWFMIHRIREVCSNFNQILANSEIVNKEFFYKWKKSGPDNYIDSEIVTAVLEHVTRYLLNVQKRNFALRSDWCKFMKGLESGNVDLILTDPPNIFNKATDSTIVSRKHVSNLDCSTNFSQWDNTKIDILKFSKVSYRVLRNGGTIIIWYDIWKVTELEQAMRSAGFNMIRLIIWQKTNPILLNQNSTYISNNHEIAVVGVKGENPIFNSKNDNGIYSYPIPIYDNYSTHPKQKPIGLFNDLINKHSRVGDFVIDPFLGSGTTGVAALQNNRKFIGCDIDPNCVKIANRRINESIN